MNESLKELQLQHDYVPLYLQTMESLIDTIKPSFNLVQKYSIDQSNLEPRVRALIGIGVSTATGFVEIAAYHLQSRPDLTPGEINEAQFLAAHTVGWSAYLKGCQTDLETFRREVVQLMKKVAELRGRMPALPMEGTVLDQVRAVFGFVPTFIQELQRLLPAAAEQSWELIKTYQMAKTHIQPVHRELIGLATAAVIGCQYCTIWHTESARAHGATDVQLRETCLHARENHQWGCYLHARGIQPQAIRNDVLMTQQSQSLKAGVRQTR